MPAVRRFFLAAASLAVLAGCGNILGIADNYILCGPTGAGGCGGTGSGMAGAAGAGSSDTDAGPDAP